MRDGSAAMQPDPAAGGLLSRRLLVISGKGGVGKSTAAASLALLANRMGKRVVVVEIDTVPTVAALLGSSVEPGYRPQEISPGLSIMNVTGPAAIEDYLTGWLKSRMILERVFQSKVYQYFVAAAPGLKELMVVGKLWDMAENQSDRNGKPRYDLVIADMPATGHGFSHLRMPQTAVDTLKIGFVKEEAAKVLRLFQDPARTAFVIVTLAEEMPVNEAIELRALVTGTLHFPVGGVVVNGVYPELLDGREEEESERLRLAGVMREMETDERLRPLYRGVLSVQRRREMNRRYIRAVQSAFAEPMIVLPFLFTRSFGPEAVEKLAARMQEQIRSRAI